MVQDSHLQAVRVALADRYDVEREIGRGGTATVFLADDPRYQRQVAIKVLRPEWRAAVGRERFLFEIKLTAQLNHPHILPLLDSDERGGFLYYVMPYVAGETLRHCLRREKQLAVEETIRIAREVAEALAAAHALGVVHRDIKPENILLHEGHAIVADFGIAKALTDAGGESLTSAGLRVGTPGYMSPEQATGEQELDQRSDVYSLGCVVYEMLVGEMPYTGPSSQAIFAKQLSLPVPSARVVRDTIPPALDEVIQRALAKVPADRYASVAELAEATVRAAQISPWVKWLLPVVRLINWVLPGVRLRTVALAAVGALAIAVTGVVLALIVRADGGKEVVVGGQALESAVNVRVGVLPPEVHQASDQMVDRARLIQHLMASELTRRRGLAVVDPLSLNSRLEGVGSKPGTDPIAVLRGWGIRYVVGTIVTAASGGLEVSYVLTDAQMGNVVETGAFTNTDEAELPVQIRQAGGRLQDALEVATGGITKALDIEPWLASGPANVAAVRAFVQGTEYAYRGMPGGREHYERALAIDPKFVAPRVWLVSSLVSAGDTAAARVHAQALQSLKSGATPFEQAMIGWAEAVVQGDLEAKARHLRVALGYSPRNNVLLYSLGATLVDLGRVEEAVEPVRDALESQWPFVPLYTLWGQVAILTGQLRGLRDTLENARTIAPQRPLLARLLEALALFEGDSSAARRDDAWFQAQLEGGRGGGEDSVLVPVYRSLAQRARELGKLERAALLLQRAVEAQPGRPAPRLELARVLAEAGDRRAAETHYRAATQTAPRTPDVLYLMGEVAARLGRQADARYYYQQYLDVAPDGPDAIRARERLRALSKPSGQL